MGNTAQVPVAVLTAACIVGVALYAGLHEVAASGRYVALDDGKARFDRKLGVVEACGQPVMGPGVPPLGATAEDIAWLKEKPEERSAAFDDSYGRNAARGTLGERMLYRIECGPTIR